MCIRDRCGNHQRGVEKVQATEASNSSVISRRHLLTRTALGALATTAAVSPRVDAFFFFNGKSDFDIDALPKQWVERQGVDLQNYVRHIAKYRLEKISVQAVIMAHARQRGSVWNELPPKRLWDNMGQTLQVVEKLVVALGTAP